MDDSVGGRREEEEKGNGGDEDLEETEGNGGDEDLEETEGNGGVEDGEKEEGEWAVEKILKKWVSPIHKEEFYLIKWVGWPRKYNSWEPTDHLANCMHLVEAFNAKPPKKREPRQVAKKKTAGVPRQRSRSPSPAPVSPGTSAETTEDAQKSLKEKEDQEMKALEADLGPHFWPVWPQEETPWKIHGSSMYNDKLLHLVILKPSEVDPEKALQDPVQALQAGKFVIVPSAHFKLVFPAMLIEYYNSCFYLV